MNKYLIQSSGLEDGDYLDNPFVYKKLSEDTKKKYDENIKERMKYIKNSYKKDIFDYCAYIFGLIGVILLTIYFKSEDNYSDTMKIILLSISIPLCVFSCLVVIIKELKDRRAYKKALNQTAEFDDIVKQANLELGFSDDAEEMDLSQEYIIDEDGERITDLAKYQVDKDSMYFYINLYNCVLRIAYDDIISIKEDSHKIPIYIQTQTKELKKKLKEDKMKKIGASYYANTYQVLIRSNEDTYELIVPYYEIDRFKELVNYGRED